MPPDFSHVQIDLLFRRTHPDSAFGFVVGSRGAFSSQFVAWRRSALLIELVVAASKLLPKGVLENADDVDLVLLNGGVAGPRIAPF